ncbi:hypothetical protein [Bartonella vinsonii]|uniref:Uncharacterized protein n=1 Tax=Bartonella vinsonii subsp. berkhoffii str. Tweed TaxID=1094502 RepID=N6US58_BARVB|nr:hypothetical protein [Bartonella vinsonii]AGF76450.1 hypothetical protein BVwin_13830 [Bartonella vinsonii subsp. berkhoffii str. Winnie]ENN92998.1 hypothetical protein BVtw_16550 [Bartonella vinsonii subsp. berkhoffii str. Tweed]
MCLFSTHSKNAKIKKSIAQLKNKLSSASLWLSNNSSFETISDMFDTWKQKSQHALYHLNEHATQWKKKAKENPKKTIALTASILLASFLLMGKN